MIRLLGGLGLSVLLLTGCASLSAPRAALADRHWDRAIGRAEAAVAAHGDDAESRSLLGRAYLRGGRFASAAQAFGDALTLRPGDGGAALQLALAQIALGQWDRARDTLERHADVISVGDRGLALALAGDPGGGVRLLVDAVRAPGAGAGTRQNLGLALALAGEWRDARLLAGVDLDPAAADRRIMEWAAFARPRAASDQVAALLHVTPVADPGQPQALALVPRAVESAAADPVERYMPGPVAAPTPAVAAPVHTVRPGKWFIQLGTYDNAAVARDGWRQIVQHVPVLAQATPRGIAGRRYRLSAGGFAYADAAALCRTLLAEGGTCYVRAAEGDRVAAWHRPVQLAAR